jgi:hypothetical protein
MERLEAGRFLVSYSLAIELTIELLSPPALEHTATKEDGAQITEEEERELAELLSDSD